MPKSKYEEAINHLSLMFDRVRLTGTPGGWQALQDAIQSLQSLNDAIPEEFHENLPDQPPVSLVTRLFLDEVSRVADRYGIRPFKVQLFALQFDESNESTDNIPRPSDSPTRIVASFSSMVSMHTRRRPRQCVIFESDTLP